MELLRSKYEFYGKRTEWHKYPIRFILYFKWNLSSGVGVHSIQDLWFVFFSLKAGRYLGRLFSHPPWDQLTSDSFPKTKRVIPPVSGPKIQGSPTWKFSSLPTGNQGPRTLLLLQLPCQDWTKKGPSLPAPPSSISPPWQTNPYSLLLQHLSTYYSNSCWAAAFYSSCFLIGTFSQMGEANRSFINPFQVSAKCVWGVICHFC